MDARPQRLLRTIRPFNDENTVPEGPLPKTIHHRNKSSPALSSIGNGVGLKGAAKRTAFGDVSNVVGSTRAVKDDSNIPVKTGAYGFTKTTHTVTEKKSAAFLRPAQRPLSVSNLKSLLTGSNSITTSATQQRASTIDAVPQQPANSRKVLSKRATTIFKDAVLDTVEENELPEPQKSSISESVLHATDPVWTQVTAPESDSQLYLPPPVTSSRPEPVKEEQLIESVIHPSTKSEAIVNATATAIDAYIPEEVISYFDYERAISQITELEASESQSQSQPQLLPLPQVHPDMSLEPVIATTIRKVEAEPRPHNQPAVGDYAIPKAEHHIVQLPTPTEPEEYWEEEDEDGYEEEGYVTARSFRSKGDNTTGGTTTLLAPRVSQRARNEIEAARKLVEATRTAEEIEDENFDTSMVAEYGDEIFEYMRALEIKMSPNPHYMDNQHEIQWSMRSVLMDWLVQVHHRFNLLPETLFLCVNYIDRFLSSKVVSLGKLQLVGATAIFIAAKYEEINCPSVQEIVYMVDGGYSIDEILKAERFMLTMLQFELGWPGPMSFLRRISKADDYDLETRTLAKYFLEVTLMDERFIGSPPSFTAAASHCLARMMLRKGVWSAHHVYYSGYTWSQLRPIVQLLLDCCEDPRKHHSAVYNKYCDKRYRRASTFVETELSRGFLLPDSPVLNNVLQPNSYAYYSGGSYYC